MPERSRPSSRCVRRCWCFAAASRTASASSALRRRGSVGIVGILGCLYLFISLPNRTQLFFLAAQVIGLVLYAIYGSRAAERARGRRRCLRRRRRAAQPPQEHRRRLGRQPRRMVRLVRLFGPDDLFRAGVLPQGGPDRAAAERGGDLRGRLPDAADRRLADGHLFRPPRAQVGPGAVGRSDGRRVADDRGRADLCAGRCGCAGGAGARAHAPGPVGRRRIWRERDLSVRNGDAQSPRLLGELSVYHADRRAAARAWRSSSCCSSTMSEAHLAGMGLAGRVRRRRGAGLRRLCPAHPAGRDRILHRPVDGSPEIVDAQPVARSTRASS